MRGEGAMRNSGPKIPFKILTNTGKMQQNGDYFPEMRISIYLLHLIQVYLTTQTTAQSTYRRIIR
jgi:hypothetical protein